MSLKKIMPYRQGGLDRLCGVYGVINGVRLAFQHERSLSQEDYQCLFNTIIDDLGQRELLTWVVRHGLGIITMCSILRTADRWLFDHKNARLVYHRPWARRANNTDGQSVTEKLREHSALPYCSSIVWFGGKMNHWSVVKDINGKSISLFDSDGHKAVPIVQSAYNNQGSIPIIPQAVFLLTAVQIA